MRFARDIQSTVRLIVGIENARQNKTYAVAIGEQDREIFVLDCALVRCRAIKTAGETVAAGDCIIQTRVRNFAVRDRKLNRAVAGICALPIALQRGKSRCGARRQRRLRQ